jgi:hypothetical protein
MTKSFDCVEMKRKVQEEIWEEIKDMTREQQLNYWRDQGELLRKEIEAAKAKKSPESMATR